MGKLEPDLALGSGSSPVDGARPKAELEPGRVTKRGNKGFPPSAGGGLPSISVRDPP